MTDRPEPKFAQCPPWCVYRDDPAHVRGEDDNLVFPDGLTRFHLGHDDGYLPAQGACVRWGGEEFAGKRMRMFVDIYSADGWQYSPQEARRVGRCILDAVAAAQAAGPTSADGYMHEVAVRAVRVGPAPF
jgi:hypothetical protein